MLHGQNGDVIELKNKIEKILRDNLNLEYNSDLDIEIIEHSSGMECENCNQTLPHLRQHNCP